MDLWIQIYITSQPWNHEIICLAYQQYVHRYGRRCWKNRWKYQSMTLCTELCTPPNISKALLCTLTHCIADSTDCTTTIPPPCICAPTCAMPCCLFICYLVIGACVAFFVCLLPLPVVSDIDRQQTNTKSDCACCIRRGLGRRLRSGLLLNLSPRCDAPCRVVYLTF